MRKNIIRTYGVLAIFLVVFTVVVVAIPLSKNAAFWLSYLFVVIAIAVQGYAIYLGFSRKEPVSSKLYGFPVARVGFIYLIVQLLASVVFMILAPVMSIWVIVVVSVIALGAAGAGLITTDAMRDEILRQDKVLQKNVSAMRAMQSKTRMLVGQCDDALLSQELSNLAEDLQFSDPVSSEATQEMEYELSQLIDELQEALMEREYESAGALQRKAQDLLKERNRICKLNKHK